jgi:acyl-CoA dehydrogenase
MYRRSSFHDSCDRLAQGFGEQHVNFDWTPEENDILARMLALLDSAEFPGPESMEEADLVHLKNIIGRFQRRLAEIGYLSAAVGPDARCDSMHLLAGQTELARRNGSLFLAVETSARIFGGLLQGFDTTDRVKELSAALRRGDLIGAVALSEASEQGLSSDLRTTAVQEGPGYLLTGRKSFVTNGPIADFIAVVGLAENRLAVFLIEPRQEGVILGPRMKTLGYNGLAVCAMELRGVHVPPERVLGAFQDRGIIDFIRLEEDRALTLAAVGLMQRVVTESKKYANTHERSGKPIFAHQEIRFKLAEMLTLNQTAQLLAYRAAWMSSVSDPEAETLVRCAKVFAAEASESVANMAMQIMAGQGYLSGNVVERAYRDAKYAALAGTTSEIARMSIADDLLKRYS